MGSSQKKMVVVDDDETLFRPLMHSPVTVTFAPTSLSRKKMMIPSVPIPSSARSYNTRCRSTSKRRSYKRRKKQKKKSRLRTNCPTSGRKSKRRKKSKSKKAAPKNRPRRHSSTKRKKRRSGRRTNYQCDPCKRRNSSGCDGRCPSLKMIMDRLCEIERILPPKKRYAKCRSRMKGIVRQLDTLRPCSRKADSRDLTPRQKSLEDLIASLCHKRRKSRERKRCRDRSSSSRRSREPGRRSSQHHSSRHRSSRQQSSRDPSHRCLEPRHHHCSGSRKDEGSRRRQKSRTPLRLHFQSQCEPAAHRPPSQSHSCQTQAGSDEQQHHSVASQASNDSEINPELNRESELAG